MNKIFLWFLSGMKRQNIFTENFHLFITHTRLPIPESNFYDSLNNVLMFKLHLRSDKLSIECIVYVVDKNKAKV